jgi:hypothetical protein
VARVRFIARTFEHFMRRSASGFEVFLAVGSILRVGSVLHSAVPGISRWGISLGSQCFDWKSFMHWHAYCEPTNIAGRWAPGFLAKEHA